MTVISKSKAREMGCVCDLCGKVRPVNTLRSKSALEDAGKMVKQVLSGEWEISRRRQRGERISRQRKEDIRAWWFPGGMRRWHFFGDLVKELGEGMKSLAWVDEASESSPLSWRNKQNCRNRAIP